MYSTTSQLTPKQAAHAIWAWPWLAASMGSFQHQLWAPVGQVGFNFKFIQPTSASRPAYGATVSFGSVPAVYGNGSSWSAYLDTDTALDRDCTILMSVETFANSNTCLISQGDYAWTLLSQNYAAPTVWYATQEAGDALDCTHTRAPTGTAWQQVRRHAMSSGASTARYGQRIRLLAHSASFWSTARIRELIFCPKLTASEQAIALTYLA